MATSITSDRIGRMGEGARNRLFSKRENRKDRFLSAFTNASQNAFSSTQNQLQREHQTREREAGQEFLTGRDALGRAHDITLQAQRAEDEMARLQNDQDFQTAVEEGRRAWQKDVLFPHEERLRAISSGGADRGAENLFFSTLDELSRIYNPLFVEGAGGLEFLWNEANERTFREAMMARINDIGDAGLREAMISELNTYVDFWRARATPEDEEVNQGGGELTLSNPRAFSRLRDSVTSILVPVKQPVPTESVPIEGSGEAGQPVTAEEASNIRLWVSSAEGLRPDMDNRDRLIHDQLKTLVASGEILMTPEQILGTEAWARRVFEGVVLGSPWQGVDLGRFNILGQ